jgi:hypothetical protein
MRDIRIQDWIIQKISNIDYEMMTISEKQQLIKEYKMLSWDEPEFQDCWVLIKR